MVKLGRLVAFLNGFLDIKSFEESAINGLQVDGAKEVRRVAFAVDGVLATIEQAADWDVSVPDQYSFLRH